MPAEVLPLVRLHEIEFAPDQATQTRSRFNPEIERCRSELTPGILARYERLKERYGASALVEVENGICAGCRVMLPKTAIKRLREEIVFCDHCGRILFDPDDVYNFQY